MSRLGRNTPSLKWLEWEKQPGKGVGLNVQNMGKYKYGFHGRQSDWHGWVAFAGEMTQMCNRSCARQWPLL